MPAATLCDAALELVAGTNYPRRRELRAALLCASLVAVIVSFDSERAAAQAYPVKAIRIIGPSSPGGGIDTP